MTNLDYEIYSLIIHLCAFFSILVIYFCLKSLESLDSLIENFRTRRLLKRDLDEDSE